MDWIKRNPLLVVVLSLSVAAVAAEICLLVEWRESARRANLTLQQRQQERDWLSSQAPALTEENAVAIAADLADAQVQLAVLCAALQGRSDWLSNAPARPTDAFFEFASFVEQMRELAGRQQIALRPDERFGFATYAHEGPEPELLPTVHEQRVVVQHVLETLFEARPQALVRIQRERPLTVSQRTARRRSASASSVPDEIRSVAPTRSGGHADDFFVPDPRLRLMAPQLIDAGGYRVEFVGQTQTLRAFLNALHAYKFPLIVRSVEVEPLPLSASEPSPRAAVDAPVPLVPSNVSQFAVTLECIEVLPLIAASP